MISFDSVTIRRGKRLLIKDANLQIHPGFRVGLTGKNGMGKSTLFAAFLNQLAVDAGHLQLPDSWVIAHMAQEVMVEDMSALTFVLSGDAEWFAITEQLQQVENNTLDISDHDLATLHQRYDDIDGFTAKTRAAQLLAGLGFAQNTHDNQVSSFSGGWKMRLNLAKTLMCRSDLLLLDEPTNHLDLDAILWLEDWLNKYTGTLVLISHDQQFLDAVIGHILNVENQQLTLYTGNYSQFVRTRAERLAQQAQAIKKQEETRAHLQTYIDRFRAKATKAKQAQSRIKQLERMQTLAPILAEHEFSFSFYPPTHMGSPLIKMENLDAGYINDGKPSVIVEKVNLQITPDTRMGLLGLNGAGKSTLIKTIVGQLPCLNGKSQQSDTLTIGYFSQHNVDALDGDASPLILLRRMAGKTSDADLRAFLGSFGFMGERIDTNVNIFSGGERARLNLAFIVWQRPNLLILDEPTNHLDISMKQALTLAIQNFTGALILVSHDRELISAVCDTLYLVDEGQCQEFTGDIHDYADWLRKKRKEQNSQVNQKKQVSQKSDTESHKNNQNNKSDISKEEKRKLAAKQRSLTAPLRKKITALEKKLSQSEQQLADIESKLADGDIYEAENKDKLMALVEEQTSLKKAYEADEESLLDFMTELEEMMS